MIIMILDYLWEVLIQIFFFREISDKPIYLIKILSFQQNSKRIKKLDQKQKVLLNCINIIKEREGILFHELQQYNKLKSLDLFLKLEIPSFLIPIRNNSVSVNQGIKFCEGGWSFVFPSNNIFILHNIFKIKKHIMKKIKENVYPEIDLEVTYCSFLANKLFDWCEYNNINPSNYVTD